MLVTERGKAMQASVDRIKAGSGSAPGMAAVIGLSPEEVEGLIAEWKKKGAPFDNLFAANFNSNRQTVISGTAEAITESSKRFTEAGARRVIPLAVAGPFHSPLIADAAETFKPFLERTEFKNPVLPIYSNVSGKLISSGEEARKLALAQITSPVRWTDEETAIQSAGGFEACLEAGPGKVLQGLWRDFAGSALPCYAAGTVIDLEKLLV
jgi:[acyl-carrier-protein] S-malonyltransferase